MFICKLNVIDKMQVKIFKPNCSTIWFLKFEIQKYNNDLAGTMNTRPACS